MTYPSGQVLSLSHEDSGRLNGMPYDPESPWMGGLLAGVSYNIDGQMTGLRS